MADAGGKIFNRDVRIGGGGKLYVGEVLVIDSDGEIIGTAGVQLADGQAIEDNNGNELIKASVAASAVNEITVANAAAGDGVSLSATGDDTNIAIRLRGKGTGAVQLGQSTSVGVTLMADQPILDSSANEYIKFSKTASAVNEITVTNAATGSGVSIEASGGDTNVSLTLKGKGTGAVVLGGPSSTQVQLMGNQPITDGNGNEYFKFSATASAVNEFTITNAATGSSPSISATGGDTNINVLLTPKGAGGVKASGLVIHTQPTPTAKTVSATLTAAELLTKIITVNQGAGGTSAQQLPTASDLDTALPTLVADDSFEFSVINVSTVDAEDASVTTNTGWTLVGSMDIHAYSAAGSLNSSARFRARKTGSAAWTLYRIA